MDSTEEETEAHSKISRFRAIRASKWFIGCTVYGISFVDGFLYGIAVPVLPFSLVDRSGVLPENVQFWNSGLLVIFGIAFCTSCALLSWSTRYEYSRRAPMVVGLTVALGATISFMLAKNIVFLVLSRFLQGLASGLFFAAGLALISETAPPDEAAAWIGFALSGADLGILIAPFLGGVVYDKVGYYWVFLMAIIVIALECIPVALAILDKSTSRISAADSSNGNTGTTTDGLDDRTKTSTTRRGPSQEAESPADSASTSLNGQQTHESTPLIGTKNSNQEESPSRHRSISAQLFSSPRVGTATYGGLVAICLLTSLDSTLPIFVQRTFHWTSAQAGSLFLALSMTCFLAPAVGALSDKYGARMIVLIGCVVSSLTLVLMAFAIHDTLASKIILCVSCVGIGIGYQMILIPLSGDLCSCAEDLHKRLAGEVSITAIFLQVYALQGYSFGLGTVFGPLISGPLLEKMGWSAECGVLAVATATAVLPVYFYTKRGGNAG